MAETSKTADQALKLLLELTDHGPRTPAALARELGLNRTVVHRLLNTLQQRGFVVRQEDGYVPGAVLVRIAERVQPGLRAAAASIMARLGDEVGETVVIHIVDGNDAVVLQQYVTPSHLIRVEHEIASRHQLSKGASGRALLAYLSAATIARVLRHSADPEAVAHMLEAVRAAGYAISHDELQHGVHGIAVPVLDRPDHGLASLAIIVPATRTDGLTRHTGALVTASRQIAAALYGNVPQPEAALI